MGSSLLDGCSNVKKTPKRCLFTRTKGSIYYHSAYVKYLDVDRYCPFRQIRTAWVIIESTYDQLNGWLSVNKINQMRTQITASRRVSTALINWLLLWVPLVMVGLIPVFSAYLKNTSETSVQDLILPIILNVLVVTILAACFYRLFLRYRFRVYLTTVIIAAILCNSYESKLSGVIATLNSLLPFTAPNWLLEVLYLLGITYIVYLAASIIDRWVTKRRLNKRDLAVAGMIMITVIFLSQLVPTVGNLAAAWPQYFYKPPALASPRPTAQQLAAKPDIYYILLEDYTSQSVLKSQLNYDDSGFMQSLSKLGFYNTTNAKSNYPYTVNSVASTLSAGYLSDEVNRFSSSSNQTMIPYFQSIRYSPVIRQLKDLGYSYHLIGNWYETSNYSPLATNNYTKVNEIVAFNHTYNLDDFTDSEIQENVLWRIINHGISIGKYRLFGYNTQNDTDLIASQLAQLKDLASQPPGGRIIFSQILAPHNYFYFNADGSLNANPKPNNIGETTQQKYTNEITYINSQIMPIIHEIMAKSGGKADIILQSDEGPEPALINYTGADMPGIHKTTSNITTWPSNALQMKYGILASYYIPGASRADLTAAADPVNIFRLLLNRNFNANLPYLPLCYYGYPQGTNEAYVYQDIGQALTGNKNASCPDNGNTLAPGPTKLIAHPKKTSGSDDD